jgi:hypothetical protein
MKLSAEEARALLEAAVGLCPDLARLGAREVVGSLVAATGQGLGDLETAIAEAGGIGPEIAGVFMGYGALAEVLGQLPEGDDRRQLFEAGRLVGRVVAQKWAQKIAEELAARAGTH